MNRQASDTKGTNIIVEFGAHLLAVALFSHVSERVWKPQSVAADQTNRAHQTTWHLNTRSQTGILVQSPIHFLHYFPPQKSEFWNSVSNFIPHFTYAEQNVQSQGYPKGPPSQVQGFPPRTVTLRRTLGSKGFAEAWLVRNNSSFCSSSNSNSRGT